MEYVFKMSLLIHRPSNKNLKEEHPRLIPYELES